MTKTYSTDFDGISVEVEVTDEIFYVEPYAIGELRAYFNEELIFSEGWAYALSPPEFEEKLDDEEYPKAVWECIDDDFSDLFGTGWDFLYEVYNDEIQEAKSAHVRAQLP